MVFNAAGVAVERLRAAGCIASAQSGPGAGLHASLVWGGPQVKIVTIGGGPGGLYFALLIKKRYPHFDVSLFERNRADDTFGFGVVFSDQTLDNLMEYDKPSYEAIT